MSKDTSTKRVIEILKDLEEGKILNLANLCAKYDVSDLVLDMLGYKPGSGSSEDKDASQPTRKKEVSNPEMRKP